MPFQLLHFVGVAIVGNPSARWVGILLGIPVWGEFGKDSAVCGAWTLLYGVGPLDKGDPVSARWAAGVTWNPMAQISAGSARTEHIKANNSVILGVPSVG